MGMCSKLVSAPGVPTIGGVRVCTGTNSTWDILDMTFYLRGAALVSGLLLAQHAMATVSVTAVQSGASAGSLTVEAPNAQTLPAFEAAGAGLGGYSDSEAVSYYPRFEVSNTRLVSRTTGEFTRTTVGAEQQVSARNGSVSATSTGSEPLNLSGVVALSDIRYYFGTYTHISRPFRSGDSYYNPIISIFAGSMTSSVTNSGLDLAGLTTFQNLELRGNALVSWPQERIFYSGTYTPEANTVLVDRPGMKVILNAQDYAETLVGDVLTRSLVTTAIRVVITDFAYLDALIDSDVSLGVASGSFTATGYQPPVVGGVPEPATWAMLITGFGLVGAAARRRSRAVLN
jgi:hypothetical protein